VPRRILLARRALAPLAVLALAGALTACDSGGSSKSDGASTSSTTRKRHRGTTTTTTSSAPSTTASSATTGTTATTATTVPDDTGTTVPPATADCGPELARFTAVVNAGEVQNVAPASYTVADCRLAPSQPIWGAVALVPKPGQVVPRLTVVFERIGSIWNVHSSGTGATGCDAPAPVPSELRLGC
jgi:hypothetical protein